MMQLIFYTLLKHISDNSKTYSYNKYNMKRNLLLCIAVLLGAGAMAQTKWYNPMNAGFPVIQNQGWTGEERENPYQRFPTRAKDNVRGSVWGLSRHSAGECIQFTTNAKEIYVKYVVTGGRAMNHMPATGVTGVDLYTKDRHGKELWVGAGSYSFGDTVRYQFGRGNQLIDFDGGREHLYTLYLPLYNEVKYMEIGVKEGDKFKFEPLRQDRPIVAYGTSITHGACASRPGMAWANILSRRLARPVINLGFSGNAYFEKGVIDMLGEIDAKAYIFDALPNSHTISPMEVLTDTIVKAVKQLRQARPDAPILLADHLGYPHGGTISYWKKQENHANKAQKAAYEQLIAEGMTEVYHLTYDELGMTQDATVEGIHPSDYGMVLYADAYEKKMREILNEPIGKYPTTVPTEQSRDSYSYDWMERHNQIIKDGREAKHFERVVIGNSIMHYWGGTKYLKRGEEAWNTYMQGTLNMGCGWDRIENMLWRVYHDELDGFTADNIYMMVGTNNIGISSEEEILGGIEHLAQAVRARRPEANVVLIGIFPRVEDEQFAKRLNVGIENLARCIGVEFRNPGLNMLKEDGSIDTSLFTDGLHPNNEGYTRVAEGFMEDCHKQAVKKNKKKGSKKK